MKNKDLNIVEVEKGSKEDKNAIFGIDKDSFYGTTAAIIFFSFFLILLYGFIGA